MSRLLLALALCVAPACERLTVEGGQLVYFRDARTGLCFASAQPRLTHAAITWCPCTGPVLALIPPEVSR